MQPTLIVLAAGMGSRYGGLKQIDRLGPHGETIIDYSVYDAMQAGFGKVIFVIRKSMEKDFMETFSGGFLKNTPHEIVFQELGQLPAGFHGPTQRTKPWGTVHALWACRHAVKKPFAVINADDYYGPEAYQTLAKFLQQNPEQNPCSFAMCAYTLANTLSEHGRVTRGICKVTPEGFLDTVDEHYHIEPDKDGRIISHTPSGTQSLNPNLEVSMNMWAFNPSLFPLLEYHFIDFLKHNIHTPKAEFVTPQLVDLLIRTKEARVKVLQSSAQWFGVTFMEDKPVVMQKLRQLSESGKYPKNLWEQNT